MNTLPQYETDNASLSDVFMHLTNYSINKNNSAYTPNEDPECRQGHKWTLASLWQHFAEAGIDSKVMKRVQIKHKTGCMFSPGYRSRSLSFQLCECHLLFSCDLRAVKFVWGDR